MNLKLSAVNMVYILILYNEINANSKLALKEVTICGRVGRCLADFEVSSPIIVEKRTMRN